MSTARPTVCVVIPTYNMGWCLARAVKSCQAQTYAPAEIIVVDDCSSDETAQVMSRLVREDRRIRYLALPANRGAALAMQKGIEAAQSDWIAFLDADDELTGASLEVRLNAAAQHAGQNLGLVYGHVYLEREAPETLLRNRLLDGDCYPYLCKELSLCQQITMLVRRDVFQTAGYPGPEFISSSDDDMLLTVAKTYPILGVDYPVAIIHNHAGQTRITNDGFRVARGVSLLVQKYREDILRYHGRFRLGLWWLRVARAYLRAEYLGGGVSMLEKARQDLPVFPQGLLLGVLVFIYKGMLLLSRKSLSWYLRRHFDYLFF
jgi:glycosyltransferase involved in cell wall biosynthesis